MVTTLETSDGLSGYKAPEVLKSIDQAASYTEKADVWALGCVLFRMIFRYPIFRDDNDVKSNAKARIDVLRQKVYLEAPEELNEE